jgi:heavy metal efflux system protein
VMKEVPGVKDLGVLHVLGQPNLLVKTDRQAAARLGVQVGDVNSLVAAAIGGTTATQLLDGDRRYDVVVRLQPEFRDSPTSIARIPVATADGGQVPLAQVAPLRYKSGAGFIYREDNMRFIPLKFSVRGRDLESTIADAQARIRSKVKVPDGFHFEWSGEFQELEEAMSRLKIVLPITLLLIFVLLGKAFRSSLDATLILAAVPLASTGGFMALLIRHMNFSVSAAVGFISLFGVCVLEGVVLLSHIKHLRSTGLSLEEAVLTGSELRMRPVLIVALSAAIGLLPAALSTGIGSETQRPLATVVVGGMTTSAFVILLVLPAVYRLVHGMLRSDPDAGPDDSSDNTSGSLPPPNTESVSPAAAS